ncbi:Rap1a/Tai family immunity protein [Occallatibacter savannae]|uniref:Rap1a/Tai family immunity protein n=1 Tax=Occallatibacter savannae TaxID=1002691 RepID=UPI000D69C5D2|nr:Rap1a/Tai family immunity protein [Occallatibacter savannae]
MKRLASAAFAFCLSGLCFLTSLQAQTDKAVTGADVYSACQLAVRITNAPTNLTDLEWGKASHCMGYLNGMRDMQAIWNTVNDSYNRKEYSIMCIPPEATVFELTKVVLKYLDEHPTFLHSPGSMAVMMAFEDTYPCVKKTP